MQYEYLTFLLVYNIHSLQYRPPPHHHPLTTYFTLLEKKNQDSLFLLPRTIDYQYSYSYINSIHHYFSTFTITPLTHSLAHPLSLPLNSTNHFNQSRMSKSKIKYKVKIINKKNKIKKTPIHNKKKKKERRTNKKRKQAKRKTQTTY